VPVVSSQSCLCSTDSEADHVAVGQVASDGAVMQQILHKRLEIVRLCVVAIAFAFNSGRQHRVLKRFINVELVACQACR